MNGTLTPQDNELIQIAQNHAKSHYHTERTSIAAALRSKKGVIYTGINIKYHVRNISMCAETMAICKAVEAGDTELDTIVGVKYFPETDSFEIVAGCGECRQLSAYYSPLTTILLVDGQAKKFTAEELLPHAFI